jgi:hypothetical protein
VVVVRPQAQVATVAAQLAQALAAMVETALTLVVAIAQQLAAVRPQAQVATAVTAAAVQAAMAARA